MPSMNVWGLFHYVRYCTEWELWAFLYCGASSFEHERNTCVCVIYLFVYFSLWQTFQPLLAPRWW